MEPIPESLGMNMASDSGEKSYGRETAGEVICVDEDNESDIARCSGIK
jgi:hypothetical protein